MTRCRIVFGPVLLAALVVLAGVLFWVTAR
jgi:hypothetical protein